MVYPKYTDICPEGVYESVIKVSKEQTDAFGRMKIGDLARQMQAITEQHFDQASGISVDELTASGKSWIITWTNMEIRRLPRQGEKLRMRIWPGKNKAVMYSRKYALYTLAGEPLMTTASLFLLMDRETRGMASPPEQMKGMKPVEIEGEPNHPKMRMAFPEVYKNKTERTVVPEEIDFNGHLNNSHYLDWAEDLIDESYSCSHEPKSIWVQYTKELLEGQTVRLQFDWRDETMYICGGDGENEAFELKMAFVI